MFPQEDRNRQGFLPFSILPKASNHFLKRKWGSARTYTNKIP
jgi:hypothetical protein